MKTVIDVPLQQRFRQYVRDGWKKMEKENLSANIFILPAICIIASLFKLRD